jgi:hypothetical protein
MNNRIRALSLLYRSPTSWLPHNELSCDCVVGEVAGHQNGLAMLAGNATKQTGTLM